MKIDRIETIPIKQDLDQPFGNGQGWTMSRQYLIVRVVAEDGTAGYGECWGPIAGNAGVIETIISPLIVGKPPCRRPVSGSGSTSSFVGPIIHPLPTVR